MTADLCRVCLRRPASTDGICEASRPWRTDEPTWNTTTKGTT